MKEKRIIDLGMLRVGDRFILDGKKYKAGHTVSNAPGYVACTEEATGKTKRIELSVVVEKL